MKNIVLVRILSVFGAIVLAVGVGFGAYAFKSKNPNFKAKNYVASADEVTGDYAFSGSPLLLSYSYYDWIDPIYHDSPITNITSLLKISFTVNNYSIDYQTARYQSVFFNSSASFPTSRVSEKWTRDTGSSLTWWNNATSVGNTVHSFSTFTRVGIDFNADVRGVYFYEIDVGNGVFRDQNDPNNHSLIITYLRYFGVDADGNYDTTNFVEFAFVRSYSALDTSYLTPRYYWFELANRDSEQYRLGKDEGLTIGRIEGDISGYNRGYRSGDTAGYNRGYAAGLDAGSDISFLGMFGAMFDSPVQAITGMFNFDFLGVNILSLVTSLFTLSVLFFIVRLILFK